jgi:flagellum-specific peptidoglycan hydrolase FlgJ
MTFHSHGPFLFFLFSYMNTGKEPVFDSIDGVLAQSQNEMTSKILLLAALHNKETKTAKDKDDTTTATATAETTTAETPKLPVHGARLDGNEVRVYDPDRIVLSVDVIGHIAAELVADRRRSFKDAVQVAYVEMKKRHNTVVAAMDAKHAASPPVEEPQKRNRQNNNDNEEEEKRRSKEIEDMRKAHCAEVDDVEREHEEFIKDMLKTHREELAVARKKLEDERNCHARVLNSYLAASRDSLRLLRKNPRYKRD